jgi:hypothetical protein
MAMAFPFRKRVLLSENSYSRCRGTMMEAANVIASSDVGLGAGKMLGARPEVFLDVALFFGHKKSRNCPAAFPTSRYCTRTI